MEQTLIAFSLIVAMALLSVRAGALALQRTGLSRDSASFQAQSAFMGVGFTTEESEAVVNHPVRRRIVKWLMWGGYSGITATVSTVVAGVGRSDTGLFAFLGWMLLAFGGVALVSKVPLVRSLSDNLVGRFLERIPSLKLVDYEELLELNRGYSISKLKVEPEGWLSNSSLRELQLSEEGVLVLSVLRSTGAVIGAPGADTTLRGGDSILCYGMHESLDRLRVRSKGEGGQADHVAAVRQQSLREVDELVQAQLLAEELGSGDGEREEDWEPALSESGQRPAQGKPRPGVQEPPERP